MGTLVVMYVVSLLVYQMNHMICLRVYDKLAHCQSHFLIICSTFIPSAIILFRHYLFRIFAYITYRMKRAILCNFFGIDYIAKTMDKAHMYLEQSNQCSICRESFKDKTNLKILKCGHSYHEHCIHQWEETQSTHLSYKSPLCRGEYLKCDKIDYEYTKEETVDIDVSVKVIHDSKPV